MIADEFDEIIEAQPGCLQDRAKPLKREIDLFFDVCGNGPVSANPDLAGDEQQTTCGNRGSVIESLEYVGVAEKGMGIRKANGGLGRSHDEYLGNEQECWLTYDALSDPR